MTNDFLKIFRFNYLVWGQLLKTGPWGKDIVAVMILVYGENLPVIQLGVIFHPTC